MTLYIPFLGDLQDDYYVIYLNYGFVIVLFPFRQVFCKVNPLFWDIIVRSLLMEITFFTVIWYNAVDSM